MDRSLYDEVADRCRQALAQQRELEDFFPDEFMQLHNNNNNNNNNNNSETVSSGLTWDTILSIRSQISQNLLRKNRLVWVKNNQSAVADCLSSLADYQKLPFALLNYVTLVLIVKQ